MSSGLSAFLSRSANSVSREVMFAHRISYDLKVASAHWGWDLRVYRPDVDREGFDLLVEQSGIARVIQLKTVGRHAKTARWKVRAHLLHPSMRRAPRMNFHLPALGLGDGLDGALLVVDFEVKGESIEVGYRFFDLAIAAAHALRISNATVAQAASAERMIATLRKMDGKGALIVPSSLLVRARTAEGVLSLLGMRTRYESFWSATLLAYARHCGGELGSESRSQSELVAEAKRALAAVEAGSPRHAV